MEDNMLTKEELAQYIEPTVITEQSRASAELHELKDNNGGLNDNNLNKLAQLWSPEATHQYQVQIIFDLWDRHPDEEEAPHPHWKNETRGFVLFDGERRNWRLRSCQDISGQVISIDTGDADDWHLTWVWRPDYLLIKYLIICALNKRHSPDSPKTAQLISDVSRSVRRFWAQQQDKYVRGLDTPPMTEE